MKIVVVGAHGQVAMHLHPMLAERGYDVCGVIRDPDQSEDIMRAGARPIIHDLEADDDLAADIGHADVVVFAAGAGPGSGAARKYSVDRDGALKLMDAAKQNGIHRYIMLSAMGVDTLSNDDNEVFRAYKIAKSQADAALRSSGLDFTIIRPGLLTNDDGTGHLAVGSNLPSGEVPREDVAAVIAFLIDHPQTARLQAELTSGDHLIREAFAMAVPSLRPDLGFGSPPT